MKQLVMKHKRAIGNLGLMFVLGWVMTASDLFLFAKKSQTRGNSSAIIIPNGTVIEIKMIDELNTSKNNEGDSFQASLAKPLTVNGKQIAAKDGLMRGAITEVVSSGRLKQPASITLKLTQLFLPDGRVISLETSPYTLGGKSHALRNATLIGGGAAAGAVLGGVAAGKKGAVIGGAVGAGAGTATAYLTGKEEIVIPSESQFRFTIVNSKAIPNSGSDASLVDWTNSVMPKDKDGGIRIRDIVFSEQDRRIIRDYFKERYSDLPPGLAKRRGHLPPGLEKQLRRNGKLPPGLQKRVEPFPQDLEIRLPKLPERIARIILGRKAMIVDDRDNILDMIDDL